MIDRRKVLGKDGPGFQGLAPSRSRGEDAATDNRARPGEISCLVGGDGFGRIATTTSPNRSLRVLDRAASSWSRT